MLKLALFLGVGSFPWVWLGKGFKRHTLPFGMCMYSKGKGPRRQAQPGGKELCAECLHLSVCRSNSAEGAENLEPAPEAENRMNVRTNIRSNVRSNVRSNTAEGP